MACRILVGTVWQDEIFTAPLSGRGWTDAVKEARTIARRDRRLALVDIKCAGGYIPLLQCDSSGHCEPETKDSDQVIAGLRSRSRRRRKSRR